MSRFSEFYPAPVPISPEWSEFTGSIIDQNFSALQRTITNIGQDMQAFNPQYIALTAGEALSVGDLCVLDYTGAMVKADASSVATGSGLLGIARYGVTSGALGPFLLRGLYETSALIPGEIMYMSTTAGSMSGAPPGSSGEVIRILGYALSSTTLFFEPDRTWTEIL